MGLPLKPAYKQGSRASLAVQELYDQEQIYSSELADIRYDITWLNPLTNVRFIFRPIFQKARKGGKTKFVDFFIGASATKSFVNSIW